MQTNLARVALGRRKEPFIFKPRAQHPAVLTCTTDIPDTRIAIKQYSLSPSLPYYWIKQCNYLASNVGGSFGIIQRDGALTDLRDPP